MAVALAPSATNTAEKPSTKRRLSVAAETREVSAAPPAFAASDWPVTYDMYAGTSGSTHGERNDTAPAAKAVAAPSVEASISRPYFPLAVGALQRSPDHPTSQDRDVALARVRLRPPETSQAGRERPT